MIVMKGTLDTCIPCCWATTRVGPYRLFFEEEG